MALETFVTYIFLKNKLGIPESWFLGLWCSFIMVEGVTQASFPQLIPEQGLGIVTNSPRFILWIEQQGDQVGKQLNSFSKFIYLTISRSPSNAIILGRRGSLG